MTQKCLHKKLLVVSLRGSDANVQVVQENK